MTRITAKDHLGNLFPSIKQMYEHYKNNSKDRPISYSAFIKRLDAGWSIKECLEGRIRAGKSIIYKHKTYRSIKEFCVTYKLNYVLFSRLLKRLRTVDAAVRRIKQLSD